MFFKRGNRGKKADTEISEIVKIVIILVVLVVVVAGVILLFKVKGGAGLTAIKNLLHFGR